MSTKETIGVLGAGAWGTALAASPLALTSNRRVSAAARPGSGRQPNFLVIVSDDAGQFNVLLHALFWIHANRAIDNIIPFTEPAKKDLATVKDQVWDLYDGLKAYKENPTAADKQPVVPVAC